MTWYDMVISQEFEGYHRVMPLIPAHISRRNPQAKLLTVQASRPGQPGD